MKLITQQLLRIGARYVAGALAATAALKGVDQSVVEVALSGTLIAATEGWWAISEAKKAAAAK